MWTIKLFRVRLQRFFRRTGLLPFVERILYYQQSFAYWKSNRLFFKKNPGFIVPPNHLAFDAYNAPKWDFYKYSGEGTAAFIKQLAGRYFGERNNSILAIYEWGCGPGRVIRHLPEVFGRSAEVYGTDYNAETIEWCKQNLPGIQFLLNNLEPPLHFPDNAFDLVYCISIFTHLSPENGMKWSDELFRVLKPNGILVMTHLGENSYKTELLPDEKRKYRDDGVVVRGQYTEGKKRFLTIHNPSYIEKVLLRRFKILEHHENFPYIPQEYWVVKKIE
jgi:ubiquinone/menaquinone biosynthesis C-methylase UbiE